MASTTKQLQIETKKQEQIAEADVSDKETKKQKPTPEPEQERATTASATTLPDDILTDIFLRLDHVPFILRIKTVCKSWFTVVNTPAFITSHLHQTIRLNRPTLMFHDTHSFLPFDNTRPSGSQRLPRKIVCPFVSSDYAVNVLGSCNGIFLIGAYLHSVGAWDSNNKKADKVFDVIHLWNPSTNECVKIPETFSKIPEDRSNCHKAVYGLGYDSSKDDYKVIRMLYYYDKNVPEHDILNDFQSDVHVYSLRSNSDKRIQDVPYLIRSTTKLPEGIVSGMFRNGAVHWLGYNMAPRRTNEVIVCFDVANEEFKEPMQLSFLKDASRLELNEMGRAGLGLYNNRQGYTDIYIMREYGVEESWIPIPPIKHPESLQQSLSPVCTVIASEKDRLLVQWGYKDLLWHKNPRHGGNGINEYRKDDNKYGFDQFHVLTYLSSLVSLKQIQGHSSM